MIKIIAIDSDENPQLLNMHIALAGLKGVKRCAILNKPQPSQIINKGIYKHQQVLIIETVSTMRDATLISSIITTFNFMFGGCKLGIAIKDENEELVVFSSQDYLNKSNS